MKPYPQIQRGRPFGKLTPRRVYPLALERIQPVIRIAHQATGSMAMPERIIFDHEFVLFLKGTGTFTFDTERLSFGPGDLFFVPPFIPHAIESGPSVHIAVHFDFRASVPGAQQQLTRRSPYVVRFPDGLELPRQLSLLPHEQLQQDFSALVKAWQSGTGLGELEATAILMRIFAALFRRLSTQRLPAGQERDRVRIQRALALLQGDSAKPINVPQLAKAASLSVSHFNRLFREWTGYSPLEYQRRQRVARARELLADVTLSIKEVAARVGFDDPYHFSRVFRELDGLPPSQYREAALAGKSA